MIAIDAADPIEQSASYRALARYDSSGWPAGPPGGTHDDYEYQPLRLDASTSRATASTMLSVHAEYSGWELARVLLFSDGSRHVLLRRRRAPGLLPGLAS